MHHDILASVQATVPSLSAISVTTPGRPDVDREELAGFALILVYWITLVLAHYYFETRVLQQRVQAEIWIARQRAAALWDEHAHAGQDRHANGNSATNGTPAVHEADAGGVATATQIDVAPADTATAERPYGRSRPVPALPGVGLRQAEASRLAEMRHDVSRLGIRPRALGAPVAQRGGHPGLASGGR